MLKGGEIATHWSLTQRGRAGSLERGARARFALPSQRIAAAAMSRRRTPATTPTGGKDGPRFGNPAMEEPFDLVRSTSTTFRVLVVGMVLFIACLLCVAPWGNATLRRTLEEHKAGTTIFGMGNPGDKVPHQGLEPWSLAC